MFRSVPSWVVDERLEVHQRFTAGDASQETDDVRRYATVRVAIRFEMDDHQQLREEDDVHQIGAEIPDGTPRQLISIRYCGPTPEVKSKIEIDPSGEFDLPKAVDGVDSQSHCGCHGTRHENGDSHDPHDLVFGCLSNKNSKNFPNPSVILNDHCGVHAIIANSYPRPKDEPVNVAGEHGRRSENGRVGR